MWIVDINNSNCWYQQLVHCIYLRLYGHLSSVRQRKRKRSQRAAAPIATGFVGYRPIVGFVLLCCPHEIWLPAETRDCKGPTSRNESDPRRAGYRFKSPRQTYRQAGPRLSSCWTGPANSAAQCWGSVSRKARCRHVHCGETGSRQYLSPGDAWQRWQGQHHEGFDLMCYAMHPKHGRAT